MYKLFKATMLYVFQTPEKLCKMFNRTDVWDVMRRSLEDTATLRMNILPPSSELKNKPSKKSAEAVAKVSICFCWLLAWLIL
jgi:hypothetical protein